MGMVEDALEKLKGMAEELGLDDDEAAQFIDGGMARKGFRKVSSWAEPDDGNGGNDGGDFFSVRRGNRQSRNVSRGGNRRNDGGNWQYGS